MNNIDIFKQFDEKLLSEMKQFSTRLKLKKAETILDFGQEITAVPIVLSGSLKVSRLDESGKELLLYYINPNESCALTFTCCMQQKESEIRATTEEDTELIILPISVMDDWLQRFPAWRNFVMQTIQYRFNELLTTIDHIAFQNLDERLVQYLKTKSKTLQTSLIKLSHEQIAVDLASSRVVISRLLKKLENDQKIILFRNEIKLLKEL
jgi:CRP/FNR family transcriptional regulator